MGTSPLGMIDLDESDGALPVSEQIAAALRKNAARVLDLFRSWDTNLDGEVTRKEFHKAMPALGLDVPKRDIDALFSEWDRDGGGALEFGELKKILSGHGRGGAKPSKAQGDGRTAQQRGKSAAATLPPAAPTRGRSPPPKAAMQSRGGRGGLSTSPPARGRPISPPKARSLSPPTPHKGRAAASATPLRDASPPKGPQSASPPAREGGSHVRSQSQPAPAAGPEKKRRSPPAPRPRPQGPMRTATIGVGLNDAKARAARRTNH
jgi:hypothetical protein